MKNKKHLDFLGIGVQKSGTTWLYENIKRIPEFGLLPRKEIHYFDRSNSYPSPNRLSKTFFWQRIFNPKYLYRAASKITGSIIKGNIDQVKFHLKWNFSNYNDNWYLSLFQNLKGYKGEITPSYSIISEDDVRKMHRLLPDTKLVLILRNPIDRARSHFRFDMSKLDNFDFDNVHHDEIIKFMDSEKQSLRSDYTRTINNYLNVYNKEQVLICFFDAVSDNPKGLINDVVKHICGDTDISTNHLNLKKVVNKSRKIDYPKEVEDHLKNKYYDQMKELSETYGGYFTKWYEESYGEKSNNENRALLPTIYMK